MNENTKKVKTKKPINPLKVVGITFASIIGLILVAVLAVFLILNGIYNEGIYDTSVDIVEQTQEETVKKPEGYTPLLVSAKVKKSTTQYNVFSTAPDFSEITKDITVVGQYLENGVIVERPVDFKADFVTRAVDTSAFTQAGEVIINISIDDSQTPNISFTGSTNILLNVLADGSANENSPYEGGFTVSAEASNEDNWSSLYKDEFESISSGYLEPINKKEVINENIINVLVIVKEKNEVQTDVQRKRLSSAIIVSYDTSAKLAASIALEQETAMVYHGKTYPLSGIWALGGPGAVINSVNNLFGLDIDKYIEIDLDNFAGFLDVLGGVYLSMSAEEMNFFGFERAENGLAFIKDAEKAKYYISDKAGKVAGLYPSDRQFNFAVAVLKKLVSDPSLGTFRSAIVDGNFVKSNIAFTTIIEYLFKSGFSFSNETIDRYFAPYGNLGRDYSYAVTENGHVILVCDFEALKKTTYQYLGY